MEDWIASCKERSKVYRYTNIRSNHYPCDRSPKKELSSHEPVNKGVVRVHEEPGRQKSTV